MVFWPARRAPMKTIPSAWSEEFGTRLLRLSGKASGPPSSCLLLLSIFFFFAFFAFSFPKLYVGPPRGHGR